MNEILDEFISKKQGNGMNDKNKEIFCEILIKRFQQIQPKELADKLVSVEMTKSDKTLNLKFQLPFNDLTY